MAMKMMSQARWSVILSAGAALALSGCAHQSVSSSSSAPGFLMGIFHGFVLPFSFVFSLLSDGIRIYSVPNTGVWYDAGFVIGLALLIGSIADADKKQS